jgi:hypothetical protein
MLPEVHRWALPMEEGSPADTSYPLAQADPNTTSATIAPTVPKLIDLFLLLVVHAGASIIKVVDTSLPKDMAAQEGSRMMTSPTLDPASNSTETILCDHRKAGIKEIHTSGGSGLSV